MNDSRANLAGRENGDGAALRRNEGASWGKVKRVGEKAEFSTTERGSTTTVNRCTRLVFLFYAKMEGMVIATPEKAQ
jgi:hypothetical protein